MIHFSLRNRQHRKSPVIIGICSVQHNAGTTCLSIALANYLCSKTMKPTACIERNNTKEFCRMNREKGDPFSIQKVRFFPEAEASLSAALRSQGYEWIVQDFGILSSSIMPEFASCDIRLMIINGSPWKIRLQEDFLNRFFPNPGKAGPITLLGNPDPGPAFQKNSCLSSFPVIPVPYLPNPFQITSDTFSFFEKIISGV